MIGVEHHPVLSLRLEVVALEEEEVLSVPVEVVGDRLPPLLGVEHSLVVDVLERARGHGFSVVLHVADGEPLVAQVVAQDRLEPSTVEKQTSTSVVVAVLLPHPGPCPATIECRVAESCPVTSVTAEREDAHCIPCRLEIRHGRERRRFRTGSIAPVGESGQHVLFLDRIAHPVIRAQAQPLLGKNVLERGGRVGVVRQQPLWSGKDIGGLLRHALPRRIVAVSASHRAPRGTDAGRHGRDQSPLACGP
jgi:hypothetical protein